MRVRCASRMCLPHGVRPSGEEGAPLLLCSRSEVVSSGRGVGQSDDVPAAAARHVSRSRAYLVRRCASPIRLIPSIALASGPALKLPAALYSSKNSPSAPPPLPLTVLWPHSAWPLDPHRSIPRPLAGVAAAHAHPRPSAVLSMSGPTMQYFSPQLREDQLRSRSLRASQYSRARKTTDKKNPHDSHTDVQDTTHSHAGASGPEIDQLRVAGLLPTPDVQLPPAPFPHAPARVENELDGPASVQEEMARAPSRLYAVNATSKNGADRDQREADKKASLDKVSTLMHLCLLKGDYERASRAWGAILRTHVAGGRPVDPRNHGRWGIGAEIALRRNPLTRNETSQNNPQHHGIGRFSEQGFELAREYYERLIIQHPTRKLQPHSVDERMFYPPMFSLWIYEVCEKSKRARSQLQDEISARSPSSRSMSVDSVHGEKPDEVHAKEEAVQIEELAQAMEIAERLDQVIASPPFDRQASLLQLRGNVALWITDLTLGKTGSDDDWDTDIQLGNKVSTAGQLKRLTNAQRELQAAQAFFERAATNGADGQAATLSSIDSKRKELAKYIEKLNPSELDE